MVNYIIVQIKTICQLKFPLDLYYNGETNNSELSYSLTCPVCGKLGLTESELQNHAAAEHQNCSTEVVSDLF